VTILLTVSIEHRLVTVGQTDGNSDIVCRVAWKKFPPQGFCL